MTRSDLAELVGVAHAIQRCMCAGDRVNAESKYVEQLWQKFCPSRRLQPASFTQNSSCLLEGVFPLQRKEERAQL